MNYNAPVLRSETDRTYPGEKMWHRLLSLGVIRDVEAGDISEYHREFNLDGYCYVGQGLSRKDSRASFIIPTIVPEYGNVQVLVNRFNQPRQILIAPEDDVAQHEFYCIINTFLSGRCFGHSLYKPVVTTFTPTDGRFTKYMNPFNRGRDLLGKPIKDSNDRHQFLLQCLEWLEWLLSECRSHSHVHGCAQRNREYTTKFSSTVHKFKVRWFLTDFSMLDVDANYKQHNYIESMGSLFLHELVHHLKQWQRSNYTDVAIAESIQWQTKEMIQFIYEHELNGKTLEQDIGLPPIKEAATAINAKIIDAELTKESLEPLVIEYIESLLVGNLKYHLPEKSA